MDKKVIKAMFANIVAKDNLRPIMSGIHFEKERCYASDGRLLVVYNQSSEKQDGKTVAANGSCIEGRYPNVDNVFPKKTKSIGRPIDFKQLYDAVAWSIRGNGTLFGDIVVLEGIGMKVGYLKRLLEVFKAANELELISMEITDASHAVVLKSDSISALIMPAIVDSESIIDGERKEEGSFITMSLENLINTYVFEGWKPKAAVGDMEWL